ncbi:unnamed protein product, partial [Ectocarpus sp. 12 AP-2014]
MLPSSGSVQGGTIVSFRGDGFVFSSGLRARFGDTVVPVTFVSQGELECTCPPSFAGDATVLVSDHDQALSSVNKLIFTYKGKPVIEGLKPSRGSVAGGEKVSVRGRHFANSTALACMFGEAGVVSARFESDTVIVCDTP